MADATSLRKTPLHAIHLELGARMMPFSGFDMPVQYTSIIEEHMAVRKAAGLFDVSHMGEVLVDGPHAFDFVQHLVTNDATALYDGRAMYTVMCTPEGGVVDDLIVYRRSEDAYLLVINAANIEKDWNWMVSHNPMKADLHNISEETALLAVQGPHALDLVDPLTDVALGDLKYYHFAQPEPGSFLGCERALLSRTGYTGEPGLEIYCEAERAVDVWEAVMEAGADHEVQPAGLGARDTLRLEAGYCLYGNELDEEHTPLEAGLGWIVKLDKGDFIGREALRQAKEEGLSRKLVGFVLEERGIPRPGYTILSSDGQEIGAVTSGSQSPVLQRGIGLGYVVNDPAYVEPGRQLGIGVRGRVLTATVHKPPFHEQ